MRMAFKGFKDKLPKNFKFIADGYSGGCIVNRVNGNNLQYKIKGDNKS